MFVKDIKPNTEYATCDGQMIVTGSDISRTWWNWRERVVPEGGGTVTYVDRVTQSEPSLEVTDPWGNCHSVGRRRTAGIAPGSHVYCRDGVRLMTFAVDGTGKRVGQGYETVRKPKDIVGTWLEYLSLHAEDVRLRDLKRTCEIEAQSKNRALLAALDAKGFPSTKRTGMGGPFSRATISAKCFVEEVYANEKREGRVIDYRVATTIEFVGEPADKVLSRLGVRLPVLKATRKSRATAKT